MTPREESQSRADLKAEFRYRETERLAIDSEGHEPTQDQRSAAFCYAREATEVLVEHGRPKAASQTGDLFGVMREACA